LIAIGCLTVGCGGDDDGTEKPAGSVSTGLPPDSRLSDLSDAQLEQVCHSFVVAIDQGLSGQTVLLDCTVSSIGASTGVSQSGQVRFDLAMCEQLVDECVKSKQAADASVPTGASNIDCASPAATQAQRDCDATVGQYERCYSALADDLDGVVVAFDCARAKAALDAQEAMTAVSPKMMPPLECAELMELCPQISLPATRPVTSTP
jgi:hypothetical protein